MYTNKCNVLIFSTPLRTVYLSPSLEYSSHSDSLWSNFYSSFFASFVCVSLHDSVSQSDIELPEGVVCFKKHICCCYILVTSVSISLKELLVAVATSLDMIAAISYWFI